MMMFPVNMGKSCMDLKSKHTADHERGKKDFSMRFFSDKAPYSALGIIFSHVSF